MTNLILINIPKNPMWASLDGLSVNGGHFSLYIERSHTSGDVMQAKARLRNEHDVVSLKLKQYSQYRKEIIEEAIKSINHFERTHNIKL